MAMRFPSRWARSEALSAAPPGKAGAERLRSTGRALPPSRAPGTVLRSATAPVAAAALGAVPWRRRRELPRAGGKGRGTAQGIPPPPLAERSGFFPRRHRTGAPAGGAQWGRTPRRQSASPAPGSRGVARRLSRGLVARSVAARSGAILGARRVVCVAASVRAPRARVRGPAALGAEGAGRRAGAAQRRGRAVGLRGGKEKEEEEAEEAARRGWGGTAARGSEPPCSLPRRGAPGKEGGPVAGSAGTAEPVPSPTRHRGLGGAGVSRSGLSRGRESPAAPSGPRSAPL